MKLVIELLALFAMFCVAIAANATKPDCQSRYLTCLAEGNSKKLVCGDDNQTYTNRCRIVKLQCEGVAVSLRHKGPCRDAKPCLASLQYLQKTKLARRTNGFVPSCREDGSYAPVQCNGDSNCWCVTPQGNAVPNTAINGRPNCGKREKSNTRRRSSVRGQRNKEVCNRTDKTQFNLNLINVFSKEYDRLNPTAMLSADEKDKNVIDWKFNSMDKDKNGILEKPEYRPLRRLIKKVVKPKKCAKTFARLCDMDHDESITRQEWTYCISDDTHNFSFRLFLSLNSDEGGARAPAANRGQSSNDDIGLEERDDEDEDDEDDDQDSSSTGGKSTNVRLHHQGPTYKIQKTKPALCM